MLNFSHQTRVFLFLEPVDMRKSFRGLCLLAESVSKDDTASGHWFAFINRRQDRLKLLVLSMCDAGTGRVSGSGISGWSPAAFRNLRRLRIRCRLKSTSRSCR